MINNIKKAFIDYHLTRGFSIHESFPLIVDDPTVLFTNATITPFKPMFTGVEQRKNFALVQKCLRLGGAGGNLETPRLNLNYTSLFDMLGSGLFDVSQDYAVAYFAEMLISLGIQKESLAFTTVAGHCFESSLELAGINPRQILVFQDPKELQHEWSFGEGDLHGCGVVAWCLPNNCTRTDGNGDVFQELSNYVQIGRIVHIDGIARGSAVEKFSHTAYDVGLGLGRVEIALNGDCEMSLGAWRKISNQLKSTISGITETDAHYMANLCRVIEELVSEGLLPGNKKHAYALRKVIRLLVEAVWLQSEALVGVSKFLSDFIKESTCHNLLTKAISGEELSLRHILSRAEQKQKKYPEMGLEELRATFGVRPNLLKLQMKAG